MLTQTTFVEYTGLTWGMRLKVRVCMCDTLMMHTIDTGSGTSSASLKFPCRRPPRRWCVAPKHQQPGAVLSLYWQQRRRRGPLERAAPRGQAEREGETAAVAVAVAQCEWAWACRETRRALWPQYEAQGLQPARAKGS